MIQHIMPWKADRPGDVTLLTAPGRRLAKLITPDGIDGYEGALRFRVDAHRLDSIDDFAGLLAELSDRRDACVIRGVLKREFATRAEVLRRIHDAPSGRPGHVIVGPFREVPRSWLMVDMEPAAPAWLDPTDALLVGGWLRRQLPRCFQSARCMVKLSGSAGVRPGARAHLWFWADRPLDKAGLDRLFDGVSGVDRSGFGAVQVCYTASPVFSGVDDPVHERIAVLPGFEVVEVPDLPPPAQQHPQPSPCEARAYVPPVRGVTFRGTGAEVYMQRCLESLAAAPAGHGRSRCTSVALRLYGMSMAGLLDRDAVTGRILGVMVHHRGWNPDATARGNTVADLCRQLDWCWEHAQPRGL